MDVSKFGGSNEVVQKWAKILDGIKNEYTARVTAQLLENQAKAVLAENQRAINEAGEGAGTTTVGNIGTFQKFAFPLVRRVYPNLVFNYIGSTQPMDAPVSQIFYLGNSRYAGTTQQVMYSKMNLTPLGITTSGIGSTSSPFAWQLPGVGAGGLAGNGLNFNYATASGSYNSFNLSNVLQGAYGSPSSTYGGKLAAFPDQTTTMGWVVSAGERLDGTGIPEVQFHIEQQPVVAKTRKMRALWTIEASQDLKAYHNLDLERELTELLTKELSLEIDRELIEDIRMLAYGFPSPGTSNDNYGGWNMLSLDQATNSNSFQNEWGKRNPLSNVAGASLWNPGAFDWGNTGQMGASGGLLPTTSPFQQNVIVVDLAQFLGAAYAPQHVGHRFANLLAVLNYASQDIYKTTLRGPGTVIITSPLMASIMESSAKLEGGIAEKDSPSNIGGNSIEYRGKFAGKYDLIVDPLFPEDEILMAYNGKNPMDAGYVYCPYVPLMPLPMVTDPGTFQPRKGIMTRYAKAAVQPANRFYRIIRVVGAGSDYLWPSMGKITSTALSTTGVNAWKW